MSWLDLAPDRDYDDSRFNQDVEGSNYTFRTIYNARRDAWTLVVLDSDDNVVATAPLLIDNPLFRLYQSDDMFSGNVVLTDNDGTRAECSRDDLNDRCSLLLEVAS